MKSHQKFPCEQCDYTASEAMQLIEHTMRAHRLDLFTCKFCQLYTANSDILQDHVRVCTQAEQDPGLTRVKKSSDSACQTEYNVVDIMNMLEDLKTNLNSKINTVAADVSSIKESLVEKDTKLEAENPPTTIRDSVSPEIPPSRTHNDILWIGSSIGHNVDFKFLEKQLGAPIRTHKAYSSNGDTTTGAWFPKKNLTDVTKEALKPGNNYKHLVIQCGSVDITNIDTQINPLENLKVSEQTASMSSQNIFSVVEDALEKNDHLEKVILLDRPPRYDLDEKDPHHIKTHLSKFANTEFRRLWENSKFKDRIIIGEHDLHCSGDVRGERYGDERSKDFDGIHLYGPSGKAAYTNSILNILFKASLLNKKISYSPSRNMPNKHYPRHHQNSNGLQKQGNVTPPQYKKKYKKKQYISPWLQNNTPSQQRNTISHQYNAYNSPWNLNYTPNQHNMSHQQTNTMLGNANNAVRRPVLLPTPEPLSHTYNVPTSNRYNALGNYYFM